MDLFIDTKLNWLIEFVLVGNEIQELVDRITPPDGRYFKNVQPNASLCVEFVMPESGASDLKLKSERHAKVSFTMDFKKATFLYKQSKSEEAKQVELTLDA
jgi:hypothetical protein